MKVKISNPGDPRKGKCYARLVTAVDPSKKNGFAFEGEFLRFGEDDLPEGSVVLVVARTGSWKNGYEEAFIYTVKKEYEDGLEYHESYNYRREFISLRNHIARLLDEKPNPLAQFTDAEILEEAKRRGLINS